MRVDFFAQWGELIVTSVEKLMKPVMAVKASTVEVLETEEEPRSTPDSYWLSGFFFPQGNTCTCISHGSCNIDFEVLIDPFCTIRGSFRGYNFLKAY